MIDKIKQDLSSEFHKLLFEKFKQLEKEFEREKNSLMIGTEISLKNGTDKLLELSKEWKRLHRVLETKRAYEEK
jgi:hypothetical protein